MPGDRAGAGGAPTAFEDASALLESLGHDVEDVPRGLLGPEVLPSFERVWALSGTTAAGAAGPGRRAAPADPGAARPRPGDVGAGRPWRR